MHIHTIEMSEIDDEVKLIARNAAGEKICTDTIPGNVLDEECEKCGNLVIWSMYEDATFCPKCNVWLEPACSDPNCETCKGRLEKPLSLGVFI